MAKKMKGAFPAIQVALVLLKATFTITGKSSWTLASIWIDLDIQVLVPIHSYSLDFSKLCVYQSFFISKIGIMFT